MILFICGDDSDYNFNHNIININSICKLKKITDEHNVLILKKIIINNDGIIEDYNIFVEEILISLIIDVIIQDEYNTKIDEICHFHNINYIWMKD